MRVGVFQFSGSENISDNHKKITEAIIDAAQKKVRLLVFQECAACGYPPVETPNVADIDFGTLDACILEIRQLAREFDMYIALGTIRKQDSRYFNSLLIVNPSGQIEGCYDKRALWGWDAENFEKGNGTGTYQIDNTMVGFRICYEVRFPEYFRELFASKAELCFVSFCDVLKEDSPVRYQTIKAHLITRAVENVMTVVSVNSTSQFQTAPTAVFDINGVVVEEAPVNQEYLLVFDYISPEIGFGAKGRIACSRELLTGNTK